MTNKIKYDKTYILKPNYKTFREILFLRRFSEKINTTTRSISNYFRSSLCKGGKTTLAVTYVGQSIEVDNTSGGENIGEEVHFGNAIGLEYKDWSFDIFARKNMVYGY